MHTIKTICVCGAGTMGSGIAQVAVLAGFTVIQFDVSKEMLEKSRYLITKNLERELTKEKLNAGELHECLQRIRFTGEIRECKADLFIEAIIEQKEAKINLFNRLSAINKNDSIFATNTSSISVSAIAAGVLNPGRIVGMHFFNPAPVMKLVELVKGEQTDETVIQQLITLAQKMGKTPVVCRDAPGFIVNRVARHYYLEAMKLLEEGYATIETIDAVMESTGFKMGPFRLMDLIGIDINYNVSQIVWEALGKPERLRPSPIQKRKLEAGDLGRKTGKGFYEYKRET